MNSLIKSEGKDKKIGFIFEYCANQRKKLSDEEFGQFEKLPSNEDRLKFIFEVTSDRPISEEYLRKNEKDASSAPSLKKLGNSHFQQGKWKEAIKFYGDSLRNIPKENGRLKLRLD
jgi:tetratricopeptide (TPR) repeat protein